MQIDGAVVGVVVTILIALLGLAYGYGALSNKVKFNRCDINDMVKDFKDYQKENKADHVMITSKLDIILRNGANK